MLAPQTQSTTERRLVGFKALHIFHSRHGSQWFLLKCQSPRVTVLLKSLPVISHFIQSKSENPSVLQGPTWSGFLVLCSQLLLPAPLPTLPQRPWCCPKSMPAMTLSQGFCTGCTLLGQLSPNDMSTLSSPWLCSHLTYLMRSYPKHLIKIAAYFEMP